MIFCSESVHLHSSGSPTLKWNFGIYWLTYLLSIISIFIEVFYLPVRMTAELLQEVKSFEIGRTTGNCLAYFSFWLKVVQPVDCLNSSNSLEDRPLFASNPPTKITPFPSGEVINAGLKPIFLGSDGPKMINKEQVLN